MSLHHHTLTGCAPTPLAHYLKALGILRLVAEQADPAARGWWQDEAFHLVTTLDRPALERFFLEDYQPTPMIAPWNKGAGFVYAPNNPALDRIRQSTSPRAAAFRSAIQQADEQIVQQTEADTAIRAIKGETKVNGLSKAEKKHLKDDPDYKARLAAAERHFKQLKNGLIPECRRTWRGPHLTWMDAAMVLLPDGEAKFPALLGSGGNDGKNDFTKQFMESLCVVVDWSTNQPSARAETWLTASLYQQPLASSDMALPVGQFLPGSAGGANMTTGFDAPATANPWDYIFLLEGILILIPTLSRRTSTHPTTAAAAPFATHCTPAGHASASRSESGSPRGEQWMPLWSSPVTLPELRQLFGEGRAQLGRKSVSRPADFARSISRIGTARGISTFQRFGYLERNGQSNLAVPLGRWQVEPQPRQELFNDLDRGLWLDRLQRAARDKFAPNSFSVSQRALEAAIMEACAHGAASSSWQALLIALSEMEVQLIRSHVFTKKQRLRPIPPLSADWLAAADDGSPEFRLAAALAFQAADPAGHDPVRSHWLPLDPAKLKRGIAEFATDATGLRKDPRIVCHDLDPVRDLLALVQRRGIEAAHAASRHLPLAGAPRFCAHPADLAALIEGQVDLRKITRLARAFMAIDRRTLGTTRPIAAPASSAKPPPLYGLFRLATLPWPLRRGGADIPIRFDPAILTRLAAGDLRSAGELALRRMRASGLTPVLRRIAGEQALARRIAVSLAFSISPATASDLADNLTKPQPASNQS